MIFIVVGAQYGGEGKGKVAAYIAWREKPRVACRCGGPNSSHTVVWKGKAHRLRMMPTAAVINPNIEVFFGAGTLIHFGTLFSEIREIGYKGQLRIDPLAGVISDQIIAKQRSDLRYGEIGSTLTGTGYATAERCLRSLPLARDYPEAAPYLSNVSMLLRDRLERNQRVIVEGHQGFGLSNYHGDYPYTSSRDSTASSMLAELGLGPIQRKMRIILVVKTFPTRNHPGSLTGEFTFEEADELGIEEYGGGAWDLPARRRRVGRIDIELVERAAFANSANEIALTGADHLDRSMAERPGYISSHVESLIHRLEQATKASVSYLSIGADTAAMVDLRSKGNRKKKSPPAAGKAGALRKVG